MRFYRRLLRYISPGDGTVLPVMAGLIGYSELSWVSIAALGVLSVVILAGHVVVPLLLGKATDILFAGVLAQRFPAGISLQQALEQAQGQGGYSYANLLKKTHVIPGQGINFSALGHVLVLAVGVYILTGIALWMHARLLACLVQQGLSHLRTRIEHKIYRLSIGWFDHHPRGEVLSLMINDIDNIQSSLSILISHGPQALVSVIVLLIMMGRISWSLTLIMLVTIPVIVVMIRGITRLSRMKFAAQWHTLGLLNAHVEQTYSGLQILRVFGHQHWFDQRFQQLNNQLYHATKAAQFFSGLISPVMGLISNIDFIAVAVLGGFQVATGQISLGGLQAFLAYVRQFNQPVSQLSSMYNTVGSGVASGQRVLNFLHLLEQPVLSQGGARIVKRSSHGGEVRFCQVNFSYIPGRRVLSDIDFIASPGQRIGIVGPTGAGKTTLGNLLMGFYSPSSGRILLDGVDIAELSATVLHSHVGMLFHQPWLCQGTIADNIAYGCAHPCQEDILSAAREAFVDQFVSQLPQGYDTVISNESTCISAGQKQLIGIARIFLHQPRVLIIDEATSWVDAQTEFRIHQALKKLSAQSTCFIIAHRLSTMRHTDSIIVVDQGRIVEQGTHQQLIQQQGLYWNLIACQ